ncbi:MAG: septal ring lytic transglycosylase RlpA family protein [Steroidobacteraceae bacterium]
MITPPLLGAPRPDLTGRKQVGIASFYARSFNGKTMANGAPMNPRSNNAASRTLPLGTTAKVTNLETGKSAIVRIEDRGPYIKGRIVDLTPRTARRIGITRRKGVSRVVVAPIAVPLPDGRVKLGAGARSMRDSHRAGAARNAHRARNARYTREARRASAS